MSFPKKIVERRLRLLYFRGVFRYVSALFGLEVIAEIGFVFLANLFGGRLLAMLRLRRVVLDAYLADVKLGITRLANVESPEGEAQGG